MRLPMEAPAFSNSASRLFRLTCGRRKRSGEPTELPSNSKSRPVRTVRAELWLWIGAVHFIPVPAVVPENCRGVCGLFQQKSSGILHIVESKQDLLAINRQYWTVGHYDLLAYPPREHSVTGYSTFRANSFRG